MINRNFKIAFLSYVVIGSCIIIVFNFLIKNTNKDFEKGPDSSERYFNFKPANLIEDIERYDVSDLGEYQVPNTVHYVWCYEHTIKYEQYLSIMSVWKLIRPDIIEFHCKYDLTEDDPYNLWLRDIKTKISGFVVKIMPKTWNFQRISDCGIHFGLKMLHDRGGIYVSDNVTLTKSFRSDRKKNFTIGLESSGHVSFVMSTKRESFILKLAEVYSKGGLLFHSFKNTIFCSVINLSKLHVYQEEYSCIVFKDIHPIDIMYLNSTVGEIVRKLTYSNPEVIQHRPLLPGKIPKYVHLVWYNKKNMTFAMYLSIRSALAVLNPKKIFIYGDKQLTGDYFDKVMKDPRICLVYREIPQYFFGHKLHYLSHFSDVIRADVLLKYGGIYMDWDVLWLKPVDDLISKGYDAVVNFDFLRRHNYPDYINLGVLMAKQNSHYIKFWHDSLINCRSREFFHNALELPYKTYEKYPYTVYIEKHLQVICFMLKCHPTWKSQYRNMHKDTPFDARTDAYAVHFTYPDPPEFANESALLAGSGRFAEIGRYILNKSNRFDDI